MIEERIVIIRGGLADLRQLVPGDGRKIVVFVMISYVEGDQVQDAIVAKGLLLFIVGKIMFLDPAGAQGMEADGEEEAEEEVNDRFGSEEIPDCGDEDGFGGKIQRYPFVEGFYLPEPGDAKDLEQRIEQQPDAFADKEVVDQPGFPAVGQVGIQFVNALERVMFDMVAFKGNGAGEELWQVCQNAGEPVGGAAFEEQVVCAFMDHDEQGVVGEGAEEISCADDHPPGTVF